MPDDDVGVVELDFTPSVVRIRVSSPFHGDPPPPGPPGPTEALWNYEVVEVFLVGSRDYLEVELSPHGHYLVLQLSGPRVVERRLIPVAYEVSSRNTVGWKGMAALPVDLIPEGLDRYNAYRIYGIGSDRRYLARFPVPGEGPDFHRLECFGRLESE